MGIDVYLRWDGITEDEKQAQYTGFSITHGHVGYLREAYHGAPYATKILVPEGWEDDEGIVTLPAATLRERLPKAVWTCIERERSIYHGKDELPALEDMTFLIKEGTLPPYAKAFVNFVELAEAKERETGKPCQILVSA